MADLVLLIVTAAFVALCVAYIRWCDAIIGPDPVDTPIEAAVDTADASAS